MTTRAQSLVSSIKPHITAPYNRARKTPVQECHACGVTSDRRALCRTAAYGSRYHGRQYETVGNVTSIPVLPFTLAANCGASYPPWPANCLIIYPSARV